MKLSSVIFAVCLLNVNNFAFAAEHFYQELQTLESKTAAPTSQSIVFYGSSTFKYWNSELAADFKGKNVVGRGFGGSNFQDALKYGEEFVFKYQPRMVVVYEGDNDIEGGYTAENVLDDFKKFIALAKQITPKTKIVFVSIKPSLSRQGSKSKQEKANQLIKNLCDSSQECIYIDTASAMQQADGSISAVYYKNTDGLHMNREGYKLWAKIIQPYLI